MGSNFYIAYGEELSEEVLRSLKLERGFDPDQPHKRKHDIDPLYLIGKRHGTNPVLDEIASGKRGELTDTEVALFTERYPNFTLTMRRSLFNQLSGETRLYSTGAPFDIPTIAALRERMSSPGYRVAVMPNRDIC